jgi:transposase-like protein
MAQRRRFSAEYKREAVAMLQSPGVSVSQIAAELGIDANVLGRWRRFPLRGSSRNPAPCLRTALSLRGIVLRCASLEGVLRILCSVHTYSPARLLTICFATMPAASFHQLI